MDTDLANHGIDARSRLPIAAGWHEVAAGIHRDRPVRIHSLGRFSVQLDRRPLTNNLKAAQQRPLDLLKALIALGGRGVHAELLSQALWPDADGDKAQNAFDVTLFRLRRLMGVKNLFLVRDRLLTLNSELAWVDVWAFERVVNHAERLLTRPDEPEATSELARSEEHVLTLYQGAFLEREAIQPWALPLRERLRSKLLRHIIEAGRVWETSGEWDKAIRCYRKGLEIDPFVETFYESLMRCSRDTGRISEAVATYQRCWTVLAKQFQVEPSPATRKLYNSLRT